MKILVTGKNGQLGRSIKKVVDARSGERGQFVFVGREELDLSQKKNISNYFYHNNFDVIVNCAAYTAVDKAESEKDLANQINNLAVSQLAEVASKQQAKLIHISTDYVFDGKGNNPYVEEDNTNPVNTYGETKLAGEQAIQAIMPVNATIIRTSWLYSKYGHNFINTMLKLGQDRDELKIVNDQIGTPTYAIDLASAVLTVVNSANEAQRTSIYHYSNEGKCSWYEFAEKAFKLKHVKCNILPITTDQYSTSAKRPANTLMDKSKIKKEFGLEIPDWEDSLAKYLLK